MYGPDTHKALQRIKDYKKQRHPSFFDSYTNKRVRPIWYNMLDLSYLDIHTLPPLPEEVSQIWAPFTNIREITQLPPHLISLSVSDSPLEAIKCPLPPTLLELRVYNTQIRKLPKLPPCLFYLHCYNTNLDTLPRLPEYLQELDCGLTDITNLPELPPNLERLNCDNSQLATIGNFPKSLKAINLYNTKVTALPDLPSDVDALILAGCLRLRPFPQPNDTIADYTQRLARHNRIQRRRLEGRLAESPQRM